ncbi:MAG TPA: hypothetical protein VHO07_13105 [Streptosporangiaceae bacterium]|jgi:hypothetical protein|nr:hypothetical protein [Streptosporangiaceae bacterium]
MAQLSASGCEDPLSGLATVPYLRTRLGELYREAAQRGTSPADTHRLLVVSLPRPPRPVAPDGPGHRRRIRPAGGLPRW